MFKNRHKLVLFGVVAFVVVACSKHSGSSSPLRSYRLGFMSSAPRLDFNLYLQSLGIWTVHADATIVSVEVPWDSLLNGENPVTYVEDNYVPLVNYCRSLKMKLWVYIDPENGLNRQTDSGPLAALGKSIAQADVQQVYRRFVVVMDSVLHPDHLGLALETNLIRIAAPAAIYQGVRAAANAAAADVRAIDPQVPLSVSVQAEVAWGKLGGASSFVGVTQDFADFPFVQELGISSYPYTGFTTPAEMPLNYYSHLVSGHPVPVFVSEGGWTSMNITGNGFAITSSLAQQEAYIQRQGAMLAEAHAIGVFQLTFTDLAISAWGSDSTGLYPFAFLGVVDSNFNPKPALRAWDSLRGQPLEQGH